MTLPGVSRLLERMSAQSDLPASSTSGSSGPSAGPFEPPKPPALVKEPPRSPNVHLIAGGIWGILYGVMLQLLVRVPKMKNLVELMSVGMVFLLPVAIGFLVTFYTGMKEKRPLSWAFALLGPWIAIGPCLALSFAVGWEGAFCLMFATPIFMGMSSVGGLLAKIALWAAKRNQPPDSGPSLKNGLMLLAIILLAPLTSGFIESNLIAPESIHRVNTEIEIVAPENTVWAEIIRVRPITQADDSPGFFYKLGFPRPIEATLTHEGVGGVRHASFEKGLLFIETVTDWEPLRRLSFRIKADAHMTHLDPHIIVGGKYFDVLSGTYEIVPGHRPGAVTLRLWSQFRLNTHFNGYAGFLGDHLMRDIQDSILHVLKRRCESAKGSGGLL